MVLNPRRTTASAAASAAAALAVLFATLCAALVGAAGPATARPGAGPTPSSPAFTVETPDDGYTCTGGRPSRQCAPRGYGTPTATTTATTPPTYGPPPRMVPNPSTSSTRPPQPELPKTGVRLTVLVGSGLIAILAGWGLLRFARRRT
jgi:LPXTG-motif cell wall-anchored protein